MTEGIVGTIREGELVTIGSKEAGCVGEKEIERDVNVGEEESLIVKEMEERDMILN